MEPEDIKIDDWERILFGLVPPVFLLEVVLRIAFIYIILLISSRLLGNRLAAGMSRLELVTNICLASAMGIPLQSPQNGLLPGVVVAMVAVAGSKLISAFTIRNKKFETFAQDDVTVLVRDAVINTKNMEATLISRERLLAQLRSESIEHLGEVKRLYIEANGEFTLIKNDQVTEGLSVIPEWDPEMRNEQRVSGILVCSNCGNRKAELMDPCNNCNYDKSELAVM